MMDSKIDQLLFTVVKQDPKLSHIVKLFKSSSSSNSKDYQKKYNYIQKTILRKDYFRNKVDRHVCCVYGCNHNPSITENSLSWCKRHHACLGNFHSYRHLQNSNRIIALLFVYDTTGKNHWKAFEMGGGYKKTYSSSYSSSSCSSCTGNSSSSCISTAESATSGSSSGSNLMYSAINMPISKQSRHKRIVYTL